MLDTATLPNTSLRGADKPIGTLLAHFAAELPWLTDAYGLVQTGVDKNNQERYPQIYRQDGTSLSTDVRPDEKMGALVFFERDGPSLYEPDDSLGLTGNFRHQLAAVLWLNLRLLAPERTYDYSEEVIEEFLVRGLLSSPLGSDLKPERIERDPARVFEKYRWEVATNQLLMFPYAACRIPFEVLQGFTRCQPRFGEAAPANNSFDYTFDNGYFELS